MKHINSLLIEIKKANELSLKIIRQKDETIRLQKSLINELENSNKKLSEKLEEINKIYNKIKDLK